MRAILVVTLLAIGTIGVWFGVIRREEAQPTETNAAPPERVQPNPALADLITQLEQEWAPIETARGPGDNTHVANVDTASEYEEKRQ